MEVNREKDLINDAFFWDAANWSKSIGLWEKYIKVNLNSTKALELGCGENGGLSLWLGYRGSEVICSGYKEISQVTVNIHKQYKLGHKIEYSIIDALSIPYTEYFDIICFKSLLGGIVRENELAVAKKVILQVKKALKPGGVLIFAENLSSSFLHKLLRNRYGALRNNWRYFTVKEMKELFADFTSFEYRTFGFLGCFGRNERQKKILGKVDTILFDKILSENLHYIISGICIK